MNDTSRILTIIAYYLSEYDLKAVHELGYESRTEAFDSISSRVGRDNNYLKLRRDEFDALPTSSSGRKGFRNRPPAKVVQEYAAYLSKFSFEELTDIVKALVENFSPDETEFSSCEEIPTNLSEEDYERIINAADPNAHLAIKDGPHSYRVFRASIIQNLKKLYSGKCQICGNNPLAPLDVNICEAHHIDAFYKSKNNDASNILIVCPNHHKMIHLLNLQFDPERMAYVKDDSVVLSILFDLHLDKKQ